MAKKKQNTVVNNIDTVNVEIDYDKLAQAIVKANQEVNMVEINSNTKEKAKISVVIKNIFNVVFKHKGSEGILLTGSLSLITRFIFLLMFAVSIILGISFIVLGFQMFDTKEMLKSFITFAFLFLLGFTTIMLGVIFKGASNDLETEKDKNYITSIFSAIVAFTALIVSFVDLFKDGFING